MKLVGSMTEKFCLNVEEEYRSIKVQKVQKYRSTEVQEYRSTKVQKVHFWDLVEMPKQESLKTPQQKLFTSHLLKSSETKRG